ncbi:formamidopyrimidine-DNA glycosylase [Emergomyces pasteurianus Ep9510]|uniref:Formamidopyrimidine-DNA glycosylase n=1 Tax=Emergomyces pasteurianus Ep9510 TaxID=1447872 RepID=A0A1J9QHX9_9EURO|nr:formamidopyrimidine-DNA glycosylase [Emergomyces pasteurianus Ep9510]
MPELAEVARIVDFIRRHLVGKAISKVLVQDDPIVFGKAGTTAAEFKKQMEGKKIVGSGQQGKYFWITMSSPPHPVMHFGMTGWLKLKNVDTHYYRAPAPENGDVPWPPKFWKFILQVDDASKTEAAFVDARRLARVRLVDCPGADIRKHSPLKENGPDPILDKDILTLDWFKKKLASKRVPIKALLLDQANISGLGNWMGDEVLYHAKIHPEQYCNTIPEAQIEQLHTSINYVCSTSVDLLGDSELFPANWLFKHRWGKGKKNHSQKLPNGDKIVFITVGGRTSAVVPAVQKKTGPVAGDARDAEDAGDETTEVDEPPPKKKKGTTAKRENGKDETTSKKATQSKPRAGPVLKDQTEANHQEQKASQTETTPVSRHGRSLRSRK